MAIRVILADDHAIVRESLRTLLEREGFEVVAEAADGQQASQQIRTHKPDIAVMDISMPTLNGVDVTRSVVLAALNTRVVLLTQHDEPQYVSEALEAGVKGYVLKSQVASDLIHALHQVSRGQFYLSPQISASVVEAYRRGPRGKTPLTPRERQVLKLISEGKSTKEIASVLGISVKTAESHRTRLMQKLDIHETASLVLYAVRHGVVQL